MNLLPESKRCTIEDCDEPRHARKLCPHHYALWLRENGSGKPGPARLPRPQGPSVNRPDGPVPDDGWRDRAACRSLSPDIFFPDKGGTTEDTIRARHVCAVCPVQGECLDYALTTGQKWGIWGGTSENERRQIRRQRREQVSA